jgi:membrane dipeptidase
MTDDMIRKMKDNQGVIQVNYYTSFIDSAVANYNAKKNEAVKAMRAEKKLSKDDPAAKVLEAQYNKDHPVPGVSIEVVADHIDHIKQLIGVDYVAIGSDFDGVNGDLPIGLKDVSTYPNLIYTLLKRGYSDSDIEKICYKNVWRVWNKVEEVAKATK